jgi:hypothetical protein
MKVPVANPGYCCRSNLIRLCLFFAGIVLALSGALSNPAATTQAAAQPELPRVLLDTTYVPPTGRTITVAAGSDFQAALDSAAPGDVIMLEAGATFEGNFVLPYKSGAGWIIIRSSAPDSSLPPPGARITPAYAGVLPKLISPDDVPALKAAARAHHYRLIGVEFGYTGGDNYGLLQLGDGDERSLDQLPNNLILDRCYIHGNATGQVQNGIRLNSASTAIIDSYISNIHAVEFESHGIAGYFGPGPYKIVNNYIEASAVNLLFGGAAPRINGLIPSDIEVRRNHFNKLLSWKQDDPSYAGTPWMCKNLFELKLAQRVLVDGNLFEHNWPSGPTADGAPQHGWAILFTVRDEDGEARWAVVQDVTFTSNVVRHSNCGFQLYGGEGQGAHRIRIANNLLDDIGPNWGNNDKTGRAIQVSDTTNLILDHNTMFQTAAILWVYGARVGGFTFTNNLTPHNSEGLYGEGTNAGSSTLNGYFPGYAFQRNAIVGGPSSIYPANNFFPATLDHVGFVDRANGNCRLASTSPYKHAGTDGKDVGADFDAIDAAVRGGGGGSGNTAPTVSLTSPAGGATFTAPAGITVAADAADSDGTISVVEFYAGTTSIGSDTTAPYSITWNNVAAGGYSLTAKATDNAGATTTSSAVNLTVNAAPTVSITSPAGGTTFTAPASITIAAAAADRDGTISVVEFYAGTTSIGSDATAPYSIAWNNVAAGSYSLTAKATDNAGAMTTSGAVNLTVNAAPTVSITSPAGGATFTAPASITIAAAAADRDGTISVVEFYAGATSIGSDTTAPYSIAWNNVAAGGYSLTAKATDNAGATTTSSAVNLTVNRNESPTPPAAPSNLAATAVAGLQINLTWTDNSDNEAGFKIEQSTDGFIFTQIARVGANATSYSVTGLKAQRFYWFRVKAGNIAGYSASSNVALVRAQR